MDERPINMAHLRRRRDRHGDHKPRRVKLKAEPARIHLPADTITGPQCVIPPSLGAPAEPGDILVIGRNEYVIQEVHPLVITADHVHFHARNFRPDYTITSSVGLDLFAHQAGLHHWEAMVEHYTPLPFRGVLIKW